MEQEIDAGVVIGMTAMHLVDAGVTPENVALVARRAKGRGYQRTTTLLIATGQTMAWARSIESATSEEVPA